MHLDDDELRDLAGFLARRFPASVDRAALAAAARVPLPEDDSDERWRAVVSWAHERGTLPRMIAVAVKMLPEDPRLIELSGLLPVRRRWPLAVAVAVVAVGAIGLWAGRGGEATVPSAPPVHAAIPAPPSVAAPPEPADAAATPPETPAAAPPPAAPEPTAPLPVAKAPVATAVVPSAPVPTGRCSGAAGSTVGYWYAGSSSPGEAGQVITLKGGATVRADYPKAENHYSAHAQVRCNLVAGDQVRLSQAPLAIPGGVWWVPMQAGDLVSDAP